jgi:hypothetical protein
VSPRKTPILIRRGGLTGDYFALTRYRELPNGIIEAAVDGKHDVTADVEAFVAERARPLVIALEDIERRLRERRPIGALAKESIDVARAALAAHRAQSEAT